MGSNPHNTPALPPPLGVIPNFVDPESIQTTIIAGLTVCLVVSTLTGILRLYAQLSLFRRLAWADAWMLLGWIAFAGVLYACLPYGAGRHQWNVTQANMNHIGFLLFIDFILYDVAVLGPKVAILLQLKDIFAPQNARNRFYWATILLVGVNIIFYVALSFALIFQCQPIAKGWNSNIPGKCLDQNAMLESSGPFNIASDLLIFLLPITQVWGLQLPLRKRFAVASAFAVGLFGCICSAVRLYYSNQLSSSGDATVLIFQNQLWANAEIAIGLLISNIIIIPRFVRLRRGGESSSEFTFHNSHHRNYTLQSVGQTYPSSFAPNAQPFQPYVKLNETSSLGSSSLRSNSQPSFSMPSSHPNSDEEQHSLHFPPVGAITRTVEIQATNEPARVPIHDLAELCGRETAR